MSAGEGVGDGTSAPRQRRVIPTSVAPITFFVREEADWMTPRHAAGDEAETRGLGHGAQLVLEFLRQRGASFFADIVRGTGKLKAEIETALWELVAAGTGDGRRLRQSALADRSQAAGGAGKRAQHASAAQLWALGAASCGRCGRASACDRSCVLDVAAALRYRDSRFAGARVEPALVARIADGIPAAGRSGEIRGGRFVDGFLGEQFALPVAVESVRATRSLPLSGDTMTLSAADPLNLVGILVPGERVPAISGRTVSYRDGVAIIAADQVPRSELAAG